MKKLKSFLALSCVQLHSNRESRSPLAGSHLIGHKCAPSSAYKCGPLSIFPSVIYTCLLLVSAGGTLQIIPREKTRTKIETARESRRERKNGREWKRMTVGGGGKREGRSRRRSGMSPLFNLRDFSLSWNASLLESAGRTLYVVRYCLQPLEATDEKAMNGIRYRHGNCCSVSFYANLKQFDTALIQ